MTVGGSQGTYTQARLATTAQIAALTANRSYRFKMDIYMPSANNNWTNMSLALEGLSTMVESSRNDADLSLEDAWQELEVTGGVGADVAWTNFTLNSASTNTGDLVYFDNNSIKPLLSADITPQGNHAEVWGADVQAEYTEFTEADTEHIQSDFNFSNLNDLSKTTISFWGYKATGGRIPVVQYKSSTQRIALSWHSDDKVYGLVANGSNAGMNKAVTPGFSEWHMFTMVYDGDGATDADKIKIYIDGVEETGLTAFGTFSSTIYGSFTEPLWIGQDAASAYGEGRMDDVKIYDRALSATEVLALYNKGRS